MWKFLITMCSETGEKARTVLLFDYQKRDPLTGNAEMIDCSELFYA